MASRDESMFLRRVLIFDAAISGGTGLLMMLGAEAAQGALGIPAALLRWAGLALIPFAALLVYLATRERTPRGGVSTVIGLNAAWVAASVLLVVSGWVALTTLGTAFVLAQAAAVAGLSLVEHLGLRRASVLAGA
jgi:hypothetical protein